MNKSDKAYSYSGLFIFFVLFILSCIFYKERMICMDFSLVDSRIIITKYFSIMPVRFGGTIPQIIPLLGTIFHLPLKLILLFHSAGMLLFYFIFFALIIFRFKNFVFAFALLFYLTLLVSDDFYWIISEYQQGMAYLCLYGAWLMEKQKSDSLIKHWWIHFLIILWIQFFYLLIVFPIVFMFFFLFFINEKRNFKSFTIFLAITIASFIFRYFAGKLDWYELEKIHSLSNIIYNLSHLASSGSLRQFLIDLKFDYLLWLVIFIFINIILLWKKQWLMSFVMSAASLIYLLVVLAFNPVADGFYIQNMFLPLAFIVALPFLFYFINQLKPKDGALILVVIFSIRIGFIYAAHQKFTDRLNWYNSKIHQVRNGHDKFFFIPASTVPMDTLLMTWATPYETLLLSSLNSPDSTLVIKIEADNAEVKNDTAGIFPLWKPEDFPDEYFNLNRK